MKRWEPQVELSKRETVIMRRVEKKRRLFGFLRRQRLIIFDEGFQAELEGMYREAGGKAPVPPAVMALAMLLQGYLGLSDSDVVEEAYFDPRQRMVLDWWDGERPPFSQGAFQEFRERMIRHDMDVRLLERTIEVARRCKEFDAKKLPRSLRVAVDSRPLAGAGQVEDTINLLGHAGRKLLEAAAALMDWEVEAVCTAAECPVLLFPSVKAGLDVDWSDDGQKAGALEELVRQVRSLTTWSAREVPEVLTEVARQYAGALKKVQEQDLEEGKDGKVSIREGVAEDRQVSIEDPEMRHGRKSKSKRFNGYKVHVATDMDSELILAAAVTPANRPEEEAAPGLQADLKRQRVKIRELDVDRGYPNSVLARSVEAEGGEVVCKPFPVRNTHAGLFTKLDFDIDCKTGRVTCPAGETERFEPGQVVHFDPDACGACNLRGRCTHAASGKGRTVTLAEDEERQQRFRALMASPEGRQRLRGRVVVEHRLSHFARKQGPRARYRGVRKNLFDARRTGAVVNRETIDRKLLA